MMCFVWPRQLTAASPTLAHCEKARVRQKVLGKKEKLCSLHAGLAAFVGMRHLKEKNAFLVKSLAQHGGLAADVMRHGHHTAHE
jgi:hypothetical protein